MEIWDKINKSHSEILEKSLRREVKVTFGPKNNISSTGPGCNNEGKSF